MKLIRLGTKDNARPGILKGNNMIDLKRLFPDIPDLGEQFFTQGWLEKAAAVSDPGEPIDATVTCPVFYPSKIICLGQNYPDHAKEGGAVKPEKPILFSKSANTINGPFDPIVLPRGNVMVDWEVELAVVIGRKAKGIRKSEAFDYIAGYTVLNDVSERRAQFSDSQWFRGKSADTFAPFGPVLVTKDELTDVSNLKMTTRVDGVIMQEGNSGDMIFDIPFLLEYISETITLLPGDIISTGTPSGVGIFKKPPVLLKPGNVVECEIEGIGSLKNPVIAG